MKAIAVGGMESGKVEGRAERYFGPAAALGALMLLGDIVTRGWPTLEGYIMPFLAAFFLSLVMMSVADRLQLGVGGKAAVVFGLTYTVMAVNVVIELAFFSTTSPGELLNILGTSLWQLVPFSLILANFSGPGEDLGRMGESIRGLAVSRSALSWGWRLLMALLFYVLVYFVVGAMAYQFTAPFYNDPALGLNLVVPALGVILPLQLVRGLIYLLAFLPVMASGADSRRALGTLFGAVLFVAGALTPLLANTEWPMELRFFHTLEGLFLGFLAGWSMVWILVPEDPGGRRRGGPRWKEEAP